MNYFNISKGSLAELETQIMIANEVGYINDNLLQEILELTDKISRMLRKLIQFRESIINE